MKGGRYKGGGKCIKRYKQYDKRGKRNKGRKMR
jgi:hypothetical protein